MKESKRESGYYWVKLFSGQWIIAEWDEVWWLRSNMTLCYSDSDFQQIDPRRIVREGENDNQKM